MTWTYSLSNSACKTWRVWVSKKSKLCLTRWSKKRQWTSQKRWCKSIKRLQTRTLSMKNSDRSICKSLCKTALLSNSDKRCHLSSLKTQTRLEDLCICKEMILEGRSTSKIWTNSLSLRNNYKTILRRRLSFTRSWVKEARNSLRVLTAIFLREINRSSSSLLFCSNNQSSSLFKRFNLGIKCNQECDLGIMLTQDLVNRSNQESHNLHNRCHRCNNHMVNLSYKDIRRQGFKHNHKTFLSLRCITNL